MTLSKVISVPGKKCTNYRHKVDGFVGIRRFVRARKEIEVYTPYSSITAV